MNTPNMIVGPSAMLLQPHDEVPSVVDHKEEEDVTEEDLNQIRGSSPIKVRFSNGNKSISNFFLKNIDLFPPVGGRKVRLL